MTVIKKGVSFKFGDTLLPDTMIYAGGAISVHCFLQAYKTTETENF